MNKNICNNCGMPIPEGQNTCPRCGMPAANAASENDKKFWERDDLKPIENTESEAQEANRPSSEQVPPKTDGVDNGPTPPSYNNEQIPPEIPNSSRIHISQEPQKKKFNKSLIFAGVSVAIIILLVIIFLLVINHTKFSVTKNNIAENDSTKQEQVSYTIVTGAEADSLMQAQLAEMSQTDSMMQAMMEEMMNGDPFAGIPEDIFNGGNEGHQVQAPTQKHSIPKKGMVPLAGRIGNQDFMMALDTRDAQNIKGSGSFIINGKEQEKLHMLGIGDGRDLTVTIYNSKNEAMGTLSGTYDGYNYEGSYVQDGKETPFQLYAE